MAYLYEFDYGDLSGWQYTVNGVSPSVGIGAYKLKNGDVIEFHYTTNFMEKRKKRNICSSFYSYFHH